MKKYLLFLLFVPFVVFAQDPNPLITPPVDTGAFITWFFSSIKSLGGASATLVVAFILSVIIGTFKLTPLVKYYDKLGKWKFIIPLVLGAVVQILMDFPKPFTWGAFASSFLAGAMGTGPLAIALREIWVRLFPPKPVV